MLAGLPARVAAVTCPACLCMQVMQCRIEGLKSHPLDSMHSQADDHLPSSHFLFLESIAPQV